MVFQKRKGFTLPEVLIAMLILVIALMAIASTFIMSTKLLVHSVDRERAVLLVSEKLDQLESSADVIWSDDITGDVENLDNGVVRSWVVTDSDDYGFEAEVQVDWQGLGPDTSVSRRRWISRYAAVRVEDD